MSQPCPISLSQHNHYWHGRLSDHIALNQDIMQEFELLQNTPDRQSHYFHDRYENIYIAEQRLPALSPLLAKIRLAALEIQPKLRDNILASGFWFNLMSPGHQTTSHCHDDDTELLSWVYYIKIPRNSGNLILEPCNAEKSIISPKEGECIFFDPALLHKVSTNLSQEVRLSVAGNFGIANNT